MSLNFAQYLRCLNRYREFAGWAETGRVLRSILACKLGRPLGSAAELTLHRWAFFRDLQQDTSIRLSRAQPHELRASCVRQGGKVSRLEVALRDPEGGSSDPFVFHQVFLQNDYGQVLDWFSRAAAGKEIKTILDIGANIGCSALFFCLRLPAPEIFCLEPDQSNYARLQLNLSLNPGLGIRCLQAALWTHSGNLNCAQEVREGNEWGCRFTEQTVAGAAIPRTVAAIDIAELQEKSGFGQVDFLKLDVEGAEADLFKSDPFLDFLRDNVSCLALEVHEGFIKIKEVQAILKSLGFQTIVIAEFVCGFQAPQTGVL